MVNLYIVAWSSHYWKVSCVLVIRKWTKCCLVYSSWIIVSKILLWPKVDLSFSWLFKRVYFYIKLFQIIHKLSFPDNLYYFPNILNRSKRIFPKMLREFGILILMFIRLGEFFGTGFEGSSHPQISLATICTF